MLAGLAGGVLASAGLGQLLDTFGQEGAVAALGGARPRLDPLVLDLDRDGIETIGIQAVKVVLFDHDGDGIRTGTGWVAPDDAWLVMDRNGNGIVDSGRELFGVDSIKRDGQRATDGFDALSDLDANQDGRMDAEDPDFANLRLWRDLNSDGISQADELASLASQRIASIGLQVKTLGKDLGNGNRQTGSGSFTRGKDATGAEGQTSGEAANLELSVNSFHREYTDDIELTRQAKALPDLKGCGRIRDLREAMSLSSELAQRVQGYTELTSRQAQLEALDSLIKAWADTSDMPSLQAQASALSAQGVRLTYGVSKMAFRSAAYEEFLVKVGVVERLMGLTYAGPLGQPRFTPLDPGAGDLNVAFSAEQVAGIAWAYERFKMDVYEALLIPTRLGVYFSALRLKMSEGRCQLDGTALGTAFAQAIARDHREGLIDLAEFISAMGPDRLQAMGWDARRHLARQLSAAPEVGALVEELKSYTVQFAAGSGRWMHGTSRPDVMLATQGADTVSGERGDDILLGRGGDDCLRGGLGADLLIGGEGDDTLSGGQGNDTYEFKTGAGNDSIAEATRPRAVSMWSRLKTSRPEI